MANEHVVPPEYAAYLTELEKQTLADLDNEISQSDDGGRILRKQRRKLVKRALARRSKDGAK